MFITEYVSDASTFPLQSNNLPLRGIGPLSLNRNLIKRFLCVNFNLFQLKYVFQFNKYISLIHFDVGIPIGVCVCVFQILQYRSHTKCMKLYCRLLLQPPPQSLSRIHRHHCGMEFKSYKSIESQYCMGVFVCDRS